MQKFAFFFAHVFLEVVCIHAENICKKYAILALMVFCFLAFLDFDLIFLGVIYKFILSSCPGLLLLLLCYSALCGLMMILIYYERYVYLLCFVSRVVCFCFNLLCFVLFLSVLCCFVSPNGWSSLILCCQTCFSWF